MAIRCDLSKKIVVVFGADHHADEYKESGDGTFTYWIRETIGRS